MNVDVLLTAVKEGAVVITVNQRLARSLQTQVETAYVKEGYLSWDSPAIISYESFLLNSWQGRFNQIQSNLQQSLLLADKVLLTPEQSLALWEQVVGQSVESVLLNVGATAKAALRARSLTFQWNISTISTEHTSPDVAVFNEWHAQYQALLTKNSWIDKAQLVEGVIELIKHKQFDAPKQVLLAGFDVLTISQQNLWQVLKEQGCSVSSYTAPLIAGNVQVVEVSTVMEEAQLMAQWAQRQLQENPHASIGLVVPALASQQPVLDEALMNTFYPTIIYPNDLPLNRPYNVSLGQPLSSYAVIQQAIRLLSFFCGGLVLNEWSALFNSPFLRAGESEWSSRACLELKLREKGVSKLMPEQLVGYLSPAADADSACPQFFLACQQTLTELEKNPGSTKPSQWSVIIRTLLSTMGLYGERDVNSVEYQVLQAWNEVLLAFSNLDAVEGSIGLNKAVSSIRRLVNERIFQPETPQAPVQIMGVMEAAGHQFDALWVCGLSDKAWPPPANPNPFLDNKEQRKKGLVQASAERQHELANLMTKNWSHSAQQVVFSFSALEMETECLMSPLLSSFKQQDKNELVNNLLMTKWQKKIATMPLIELEDTTGPTVAADVLSRGGVGLIKDQAACAFKAFARHRLILKPIEEPVLGLDARMRGSLVHRCLEIVWRQLKTHQNLVELKAVEENELIERVVRRVIQQESQFTPILKGHFGHLERQRLKSLLSHLLSVDRQREPFEVSATELKQQLNVGRLNIKTSIDRVDKLQDGSTAIIDYKTGGAKPSSWFGDRPEEPQLPLYSVFGEQNVTSLSFAQLKKGSVNYVGITNTADSFSMLEHLDEQKSKDELINTWSEQMQQWETIISALANDFSDGVALVNPTKKACDYCDLAGLCRINSIEIKH